MINFIVEYYEYIALAIAVVGAVLLVGRSEAKKVIAEMVHDVRDEVGNEIFANREKYAEAIHSKLPKKFKTIVTKKLVVKVIKKVALFIDSDTSDLDIKK